jgi:hypothetical protein
MEKTTFKLKQAREFAYKNGYLLAKYTKTDGKYLLEEKVDTETPDDTIVKELKPCRNNQINYNCLVTTNNENLWILYNTGFLSLTLNV